MHRVFAFAFSRRESSDDADKVLTTHRLWRASALAGVALMLSSMLLSVAPARSLAASGPTFVQATASSSKTKVAFTNPVAVGDLLVAGITTNDAGTDPVTGVSDSLNGAWTKVTSLRYGNGHVDMYYFAGTAAGMDTVTFTGGQSAYTLAEYSGVQTGAALDQFASKASSGSSPAAGPTASIGGANELVIGVGGNPAPSSSSTQFTAGTGLTLRTQAVAAWLEANGLEDTISTSTAGQSITMKAAASAYYGAIVAVFKSAPAAAPKAALNVTPASGGAPLAVTADASGSTDPIGISSYTFNFGDGTTVGPQAGATAAHTYSAGGKFNVQVTIADSANATASATQHVTVGAPVAALSVNPSSGVTPLAVTADASASTDPIGISSYTFNFGDGSAAVGPQAGATATHTYTTAGSYAVTVTAADSVGASSSATATVITQAPPTAALSVSPSAGAAPLGVTADASASTAGSNPIASYTFVFGDGTSVGPQAGATAGHTYSAGGAYALKVTVTDSAGNSSSTSKTVSVGAPVAALNVTPSAGAAPLGVTANASGSTDAIAISSYTFNFGDGSAAVGPQASAGATHTYIAGGTYTVTVTVTDAAGATATASAGVSVGSPHAAFTLSPSSGPAPLSVGVDASSSTDPLAITSYSFDFGDGTTAGPQAGPTASHVYTAGGTFNVKVTITDAAGATNSATSSVTVGAPVAALQVSPASGGAPLNVTADASGSTDAIGITSYTFNFGDGTVVGPQAGSKATHTYTVSGPYTVTVNVADSTGASASASASVSVTVPPSASLTVTPSTGPAPLSVTADASASTPGTNPIASYTFNFGDGTTVGPQTSSTATHNYSAGGNFTVTVTLADTTGVSSTATAAVTATAPPTAALTVSPSSGATPLAVTADASGSTPGSKPIATYTFNFGDGTVVGPQASAVATHTYSAAGSYTVTVTVTDTAAATATATRTVTAIAPPSAALSVSPQSGGASLPVTADASASTAGTNAIASYTFNFGDGTASVGPQAAATATHTYTAGGLFVVKVTVTDTAGFTSSTTSNVTVGAPSAKLGVNPTVGAVPLGVTADASASTDPIGITSYTFNFGDGTVLGPQAGATAGHTYSVAGVYTVTVTVADSTGASSSATVQVSAVTPATAALTVSPNLGATPLAVTADASGSTPGSNAIANYTFDFGDGTTVGPQASATASHTYGATGTYTVRVTVTDTQGVTSTATASAQAVTPATARVAVNPQSGGVPLAVTADASGSTPGTNPIASYTVNFGDGSTPVGPSSTASWTHTYTSVGTYNVLVMVTDTAGITSSAGASVSVVNPPSANVTASPATGTAPVSVTADASGSTDALGISSYSFNFGDGSPVVGPQASAKATHTYITAGNFTITVTVTDPAAASSTATVGVAILAPPTASLSETPLSGFAPLTVTANASASTGGSFPIGSYTFNFGDGTPAVGPQTGATASHTYFSPGNYTTTLTVTDTQGNTGTASMVVNVSSGTLVQDTFQRANQSGWGTASDGLAWAAQAGDGTLSVSGGEGVISNSSCCSQFVTLGSTTTTDGNGLVRFSVSGKDSVGVILRYQALNVMDLARYDGAGHLQFMYRNGGSWTTVSSTPFTPTIGVFYWLRFEVQGSNVGLKVWPSGTAEPSASTWSGTVAGVTGAGKMGLYGYATSGSPLSVDSFSVSSVSSTPPNSTITGTVTAASSGGGIAGVVVSTIPATTTAITDAFGAYSVPVPAATYTVVFTGASSGYNANYLTGVVAPVNGSVSANQKLVGIPAQVAMDTFTQPDQTGGWSPSTDGHSWSSDLGSYPGAQAGITGSQAWVDTSGSTSTDFDTWMGYQYQNQEVSADLEITKVVSDPTFQHGARLMARVQASSDWLLMTIDPPNGSNPCACPNGDLTLWVVSNNGNTWTRLAALSQTVSTGIWYHAKIDVIGSLVEGKVWAVGSSEPAWQITAVQTALFGTGQAGTRTTGAFVNWSNFRQTPITQISGTVTSSASGSPIAGATVTLNTGASTTTDVNGNYTFGGLSGGVTYTITASATGFTTGSTNATTGTGTTVVANIGLS